MHPKLVLAVLMQEGRPELLAVVFGMERFHTYVYAQQDVTVETDHKPLISISKKALSSAPKRLQRLLLRLQRYTFSLVYRPGSELVLADTLSRAYPPADTTDEGSQFTEELAALMDEEQLQELRTVASQRTIDAIYAVAAEDDEYTKLMNQIAVGWPSAPDAVPVELRQYTKFADELTISGRLVYKGSRVVILRGARNDILRRIHSSHIGVNGCIRRAREAVFFPGITAAIKDMVSRCPVCVRYQNEQQKEPLMSHPALSRPWHKVGTDIFSFHGQDYLVTVDYLSGYFEVDRLPSKKAADVIYALRLKFARHGIPSEVMSDGGPVGAAEFKAFADRWEFVHTMNSPRFPQSNGRVENAVKTAKRLMMKARVWQRPAVSAAGLEKHAVGTAGCLACATNFRTTNSHTSADPGRSVINTQRQWSSGRVDRIKATTSVVLQSHGEGAAYTACRANSQQCVYVTTTATGARPR